MKQDDRRREPSIKKKKTERSRSITPDDIESATTPFLKKTTSAEMHRGTVTTLGTIETEGENTSKKSDLNSNS